MRSIKVLLLFALVTCFVSRGAAVATFTDTGPRTAYPPENSPADTVVTRVSASDPAGGAFTFEIQNVVPTAAALYFVASDTGVVTVASGQTPDREVAPAGITFDLVLMQSGLAQGNVTVTVILQDVNDNSPVWNNDPGMPLRFNESLRVGSLIRILNVTDEDSGLNGNVFFTLTAPIGGPFSVGRISGLVTLRSSLDYETQMSFTVTIVAQDQGNPSMSTTITLTVNVLDSLEPAPTFTRLEYSVSIAEGSYTSAQVLGSGVVRATDLEGGTVNYRYRQSDIITDGLFSVDAMNGDATVQGTLDRELSGIYSFGVDAYTVDSSVIKSEVAIAFVVVTVRDVNDNAPIFGSSHYSSSVTEDAQQGNIVLSTISAFDLDEGSNAVFEFQIATSAVPFSINPTFGTITVSGSLDYETTTSYTFTVQAVDYGSPARLTGTAQVIVDVTNVRDNPPIISYPTVMSPAFSQMEEATPPQTVFTVAASDADGDSLIYSLTPAQTFFTVDSSGVVRTAVALDREAMATHSFTVEVCDPVICASVPVTVDVTDINDNAPVFDETSYSATVSECSGPVNSVLATVVAQDTMDIGVNAVVVYEVVAGDTSTFTLERNTGSISLASPTVDYETGSPSYSLTIQAQDNPSSTPKLTATSTAVFTLMVMDCNDFPPVFNSTDYSFTISERSVAAAADEDVYTGISVMDQDGTAANRMVRYQLAGGLSSTNHWLNINSATGNIFIRGGVTVDREASSLNIDSLGRGVLTFNILAVNDAPTATFTATATVTAYIMDINDNSPVIQQMDPIGREVMRTTENGTLVTMISATDADYGDNSHIVYNITSGNRENKFAIDRNSGMLYVNGDLEVESRVPTFILIVSAENDLATGAAPDTITVVITIILTNLHPPVFNQSRYDATIMEYDSLKDIGEPVGTTVDQVFATDEDGMSDPAGQIEYTITGGNELGIFDILSGTITVERPDLIDYETTRQFDLIVTATDLVVPENDRRQDSTHLVITVVDVNDHIPTFEDNEYYGTVLEGLPTGSTVTVNPTIRVSDADQDGNEPLTIEFVDGSPNLAFRITTDGRTVTTSTQLDREMNPTFNITLRVQDMATHETRVYLIINITDFNDNPPQFSETPAQLAVRIPENLDVGEIVQIVNVTDADIDNNAVVIFSMRGDRGYFDIDIHTGVITLIQSLDRETIHMYNLTIIATNPTPTTLNSSTTFVVTVENRNDNDPVFTMPVFVGNVTEEVPVNTSLNLYVHAEDLDPGSTIQYTLIPGTTTLFDVNPNTGQIYTTGRIDRETNNFQFFMVEANDTLIGSMKPSALVEVGVLDINDQSPVFENELYENDVYELTPAGAIILIVTANDQDIGTNAEIEYTIDSVSPSSSTGLFGIDTDSGNISPTREVTLMSGDPLTINLTIRATDKGPGRNSGTAKVVLSMIDRNTNGPQFEERHYNLSVSENVNGIFGRVRANESSTDFGENARVIYSILPGDGSQMFHIDAMGNLHVNISLDRETRNLYTLLLAASDNATIPRTGFATVSVFVEDDNDNDPYFDPSVYPISISESTEVGATVIRVLAFDDDIGTNGQLSLNITSGNTTVFQVNNDGIITTSAALDREQVSQYIITITAVDMGVPMRSQTADVIITINDVNDNSPSFVDVIRDSEVYENARSGHQLTTVQAIDPDYQLNGFLAYSFNNGSLLSGPFQIDPELGQIILQGTLDREEEDTYSLTVTTADQRGRGLNVRRTTAPFTVRVLDVNDNVPFFINSRYDLSVLENHPQGVTIGQVRADDNDIGSNAVLYYHLLGGSTTATVCDGVFCIHPTTGGIYLKGELDRETEVFYILQAAVSNQLNLTFNGTSPENATTAPVTVLVEDVNDNPPQFISTSLRAAVAEEAEFGTTVTTIVATDLDIGSGQVVWFEFTTPQVPFLVDRDSGVVTTSGVFQGLSGTRYTVTIRAYDNKGVQPSLSTTTSLVVQVFKTTEQVILTFNCHKEDVEANIDQIHSVLASIIQATVEITQVRVKRAEDGTVDVTRSDVLFFVLDSITGDVIHPEVVLQVIDQSGVAALEQAAGSTCTIESIRINSEESTDSGPVVPVWVWPVIAVMAAIIAFVCSCFLCGLVLEKRRSRRLKKRGGSEQYSQFTSQASDYNAVNNPLWVAPYDNWEEASTTEPSGTQVDRENPLYESQELTIEMFQDDDEDLPSSREHIVKAPPLTSSTPARESTYSGADDDELLAEAIGEERKGGFGYDSETSLI